MLHAARAGRDRALQEIENLCNAAPPTQVQLDEARAQARAAGDARVRAEAERASAATADGAAANESPPSSTARPWPISARTGPLAVAEHPEPQLMRWRRAGLWCDDRCLRVTGVRGDHRPDARFRVRTLAPMENLTAAERPKAAAVAPATAASSARLGAAENGKLDQHGGNAANWRLAAAPTRRAAISPCRTPVRQPSVVVSGGLAECD